MISVVAQIPYPQIDPVLFRLGPLAVRWYGLAYLLGFLLGYALLQWLIRRRVLRLTREAVGDLVIWLVLGVMIGGRAGWWLFYHRSEGGAPEPWYEPFAIWHGGMSFHGGLIGVTLALLAWSWQRRAPFWNLADALALVTPVGLFFGRLANFINVELVGRPTTLPLGVVYPGESFARHPSQLYEAVLEGPLLLITLWALLRWRRPHDGRLSALFLILYGTARFAVEFTRQPDPQLGFIAFGWLTMGQLLSTAMVAAGMFLWWARRGSVSQSIGHASAATTVPPADDDAESLPTSDAHSLRRH